MTLNRVMAGLRRLLGGRPLSRSPRPFQSMARSRLLLMLEQLETRDLLAAVLPAPSAALTQHPADNPTLPAAFDVFNPPVANLTIDPAAPQLATLSNQAKPDDSVAATGFQFSTLANGSDTSFQVYGQTSAANATLNNATIQELDGDRAVATLGANLPQNSMYLVWATNAAGASLPFAVNKTQAWWIGSDTPAPGDTVSVYGQNLSNGAATPQSWIYLQPTQSSQGAGEWITPTKVNPYKVDFVVPSGLAAGSYQVWVHNGHGGQYGWSSPVTLTVQAHYDYSQVVVKLSDFPGGLPNTGVDATPAFAAAIRAIADHTGTIQLQAGTYYLAGSSSLYITGGLNLGIDIKGAGKNATFIKALPGFTGINLLKVGKYDTVSDLTVDTTGATLSGAAMTGPANMTNVAVIAHGYQDVIWAVQDHIVINNCDFTGEGIFLPNCTQVLASGDNFYATDGTNSLFYMWSGSDISITNCTAQDFNASSPNHADHGNGRFFTGMGIWGTQSNIYLGDNRTINFSQPKTWGDQNTGEQIMWEGNDGTQSTMVTTATDTTATLANLGRDWTGQEAVVVSGKGTGQHRTITATDFATGGTTLTLDHPWDVVPDATTRINIITTIERVAIYHNSLQGNGNLQGPGLNGQAGSASTGIEPFQGGFDFVVDSNTISDLRYGISDFSYTDNVHVPAEPLFSNLYQNNTITNCSYGIRSIDAGNAFGEEATHLGNIYRANTMTGIQIADWWVNGGYSTLGATMDLDVFEHNYAADAPIGIQIRHPSNVGTVTLVVYKNVFDRGAAPAAGSLAVDAQAGFVELFRGNTFANFLIPQNPVGTIVSLLPTFTWNAIPGSDHYDVMVWDLTTGAQAQRNTNVTTTSWTLTAPLVAGHGYVWWVRAMASNAPASNWSAGQNVFVAALAAPVAAAPGGALPIVSSASLAPAFTWSAVNGADSYDLYIYDWNAGQSAARLTTAGTTWTPPTPLAAGHHYQWWVRALNQSGNSGSWSNGASFSLALAAPTTAGPTGSILTATPTFGWNRIAGADFYDVYVADAVTGGQVLRAPLSGAQVVTGTSWTAPSALTPGAVYTWWVRAMTRNGGVGPWSPQTSFTVAFLPTPSPIAPTGTIHSPTPTLTWRAVVSADYYDVWVDDTTLGKSQILRNVHVGSTSLVSAALTVGHSYRWRVRSVSNNGDYSIWTAWDSFTVAL